MIYLYSQTPFKHPKILHQKLIDIEFLPFIEPNFKEFDSIVFTSKIGVKSMSHLFYKWRNLSIFTIGEATKNSILELGECKIYLSNVSYGDEFAFEILPILKEQKVLIIRAKEVVSNIDKILNEANIKTKTIITYKSTFKNLTNMKAPEKNSTLIFTAPSITKCFLNRFSLSETYNIICIGKKTASVIPKKFKYHIPNTQSIQECVKLALKLEEE